MWEMDCKGRIRIEYSKENDKKKALKLRAFDKIYIVNQLVS
jgi:hypothetical protein